MQRKFVDIHSGDYTRFPATLLSRVWRKAYSRGVLGAYRTLRAFFQWLMKEEVMAPVATRRWVVERRFAWMARFRRLARDFERTSETFRSLHFLAFAILMLHNFVNSMAHI